MTFKLMAFIRHITRQPLFGAAFCAGLFLVPPPNAEAQHMFAYRSGARGTITYSTKPPKGKNYWKVKPRRPTYSTIRHRGYRWRPVPARSRYDELIKEMAKAYKLDPALVKAVVHVESAFRERARSHAGAMGLMQLMPATAERFGVRDAYRPSDNVMGGVRYLRWLFNHFDGNLNFVLAGYNAGENAVKRYGGIPPYRETQQYVQRVRSMMRLYRCDYEGRQSC